MTDHSEHQPCHDIVPILIGLCAKSGEKDRSAQRARINALFSILGPSARSRPIIASHWLLALHKTSPGIRPASVRRLMTQALRNAVKLSPEQTLILSAGLLSQTEPHSELSCITSTAFRRAFDAAMQKDPLATRVPHIAREAAKQVFDVRADDLTAVIHSGVMRVYLRRLP